ncbi:MAG: BamA/TamA family outer membrane protein [Gemmatimonadales bacterium]
MNVALLLLPLALSQQDPPQIPADSYADSATAALVAAARAGRERNERLVTSYTANVSQRFGVGIRAARRDRMLYRQEMTAKIEWYRDKQSKVEVTGAREGVPIALRKDQVPEDLRGNVRDLVINPAEDYLRVVGVDNEDGDNDGFIYPLREGGERDYRFAAGDSTVISLPTGKRIRLLELKVIPRRSDWKLMSGSLWYDADTYGLVRAVFRPARPFELQRDLDPDDKEDVPSWVNAKGEVKFVTLEYGLYENRWWMLRYMAMDAEGSMGTWLGVPFRMERVYSDYEVEGGTPPDPTSTFRPAGTVQRNRAEAPVTAADSAARRARADSIRTCVDAARDEADMSNRDGRQQFRIQVRRCTGRADPDSILAIVIPEDSAALLVSPTLGEPILQMGDMITEQEIKGLSGFIEGLPSRPWQSRVELPKGVGSLLQGARYNRVEALSLSARGRADFGKLQLDGRARIGLADGWPNLEGGLSGSAKGADYRLAAYRRLAAANPEANPFGPVNSFFGLMAHRDDGQYYRATGAELTQSRSAGKFVLRAYYERQRAAQVETDFSIPHLLGSEAIFRPNIIADSADQFGASLAWRADHPFSRSFSVGLETFAEGAGGDFEFGRGSLTLRGLITPEGPLAVAFSASAGTSTGSVPIQSQFYLGGPTSLRGYDGGAIAGESFWAARGEVANSFPAARISLFSDIGWAGPRAAFSTGKPLIGAGVGASFLDGLIRMDLSRRFRGDKGFRFDLYFDGIL